MIQVTSLQALQKVGKGTDVFHIVSMVVSGQDGTILFAYLSYNYEYEIGSPFELFWGSYL